jgi:hypothetical protein
MSLVLEELEEAIVATDTEYLLAAGQPYAFSCNGTGVWKHWDGVDYVSYAVGTVDGKNFVGNAPVSGKVKLDVTGGAVTGGFKRV